MKIRLIVIKPGDVSEKTLLNLCYSKRLDPYGGKTGHIKIYKHLFKEFVQKPHSLVDILYRISRSDITNFSNSLLDSYKLMRIWEFLGHYILFIFYTEEFVVYCY